MNPDFWIGRWERGEIGWHQSEVEPGLVAHLGKLAPTRVLVPLCGKSLDLAWLASQGHEVVGVELSEKGIRAFFEEQKIPFTESTRGQFKAFVAPRLTLLQGDIFDLTPDSLGGPLGAIYDRAALIALPSEVRARYAAHLIKLVKGCWTRDFVQLQIVLERKPHDAGGPPHSVLESEVRSLYGNAYSIELLSRDLVDESPERRVEECIYEFRLVHDRLNLG
jgi:thiopurine S-methyltransferase